jgi:hypothetical protein
MIELTFRTADGPIVIQVCDPVATPGPDALMPWTLQVITNGRPQTVYGLDPVDLFKGAAEFMGGYLYGREGLDPPIEEPRTYGKKKGERKGKKRKRKKGQGGR